MDSQERGWKVTEAVPPWERATVARVIGTGVAFSALAALGELADSFGAGSAVLDGARLTLAAAGILVVGLGIWLRPDEPLFWLGGSAACLLGLAGFPAEWDSARLVAGVWSVVALAGAVLVVLPPTPRKVGLIALALAHFGGILTAVTGPPPQPWLTGQSWVRIYRPYLQFIYMNNAYQFYSPDPGPAFLGWALVEFDTDDPDQKFVWYRFPQRPTQVKDPLAMTYFRHLALTEQLNSQIPTPSAFELKGAELRRATQDHKYPRTTPLHTAAHYRLPTWEMQRRILPAYTRRIARMMSERYGLPVKTVKLYRVEHRIIEPKDMAKPTDRNSPYHMTTFVPYYYGTYDSDGELLNPNSDPMLYWQVPIVPKTTMTYGAAPAEGYEDNLSEHAGHEFDWSKR